MKKLVMAGAAGFEPADPLRGRLISNQLDSANSPTRPNKEVRKSKKQTQPSLDVKTLFRNSFCFYIFKYIERVQTYSHIVFIYHEEAQYEKQSKQTQKPTKTKEYDVDPRRRSFR